MYLVDFQTYILDEQQKDKKQNCTTMPPSHYVIDSFLFYLFSLKKHFHLFFALIFSSRSPLFFNHKKNNKKTKHKQTWWTVRVRATVCE